jgi:dephospho-CoA kinase
LRIGLTGGIASGKTTVSDLFAELGAIVIDTDIIAREVVAAGQPALEEIRAAFGADVFNADGSLNRSAMRHLIFADDQARAELEGILHPRIQAATLSRAAAADGPYMLIVVPLLANSPLREHLDRVLVVDCDESTQIERLLERDAESAAQARRILAAQASRAERLAIADDVIENNSTLEALAAQVSAMHERYISLANLPAG